MLFRTVSAFGRTESTYADFIIMQHEESIRRVSPASMI